MSQVVATHHNFHGASLTDLPWKEGVAYSPSRRVLVNVSKEPLEVKGGDLSPRAVRAFLWNNRRSRFVKNQGVLWTVRAENKSVIGLGLWVSPEVADKIKGDRFVSLES
jgi:hypothetical protein